MLDVHNAKELANQATACPVRDAEARDCFKNLTMGKNGEAIKRSIIKRQEALERFQAKRREFLITKEQITKDIEEARIIWNETLKQIPRQPFS
jgi:hypothetical protein